MAAVDLVVEFSHEIVESSHAHGVRRGRTQSHWIKLHAKEARSLRELLHFVFFRSQRELWISRLAKVKVAFKNSCYITRFRRRKWIRTRSR